ncbi:hypothetical protein [Pseudomonas sp. UFMG81]|uniref:hypothetical protein n=1 Tax=Pseudomonas sp. UFMG81 TaxID=2745936 RepID=UPI00188ED209|nr:hypothetical protein [Pseudomonas sp. UFMG81]
MNTLHKFVDDMRATWGPLTTQMVAGCQQHLDTLLNTPVSEPWLATLHLEAAAQHELYRDPQYGFVLLAHTEHAGLYRPPHDHGRGWVIYAVQQGAIEMSTYARVEDAGGQVKLVKRGSTVLCAGQTQLYLPGDIHDTRCVAGPALLFRFTERDLKKEDREARRLTRYVEQAGDWVPEARV